MTLTEMKQSFEDQVRDHVLVSVSLERLECNANIVRDAIDQIQKSMLMVSAGVMSAKQCRAEALLILLLQGALYHGYTPKV